MKTPRNLEEAEETFGLERVYKSRRRKETTKPRTTYAAPVQCESCNKRGYRDEESARFVIGHMIQCGRLTDDEAFAFRPYMCPHGWWHTGHDPNTRRLFRPLKQNVSVPAPRGN
jgi:hypothetical protein